MTNNKTLTQIYSNVWRLVADNSSAMTGPGTNTYLVGAERMVIIDPGPHQTEHVAHIVAALATLKAQAQAVIITHPHSDHNGCADLLCAELDVPLLSFGQSLQHGSQVTVGDLTLEVYHTPGHIYAHICLLLLGQQLLWGGDLVAGLGTILIIPPDGDMAAYLDSLRAMKKLAPTAILPGHGPIITDPQSLLQEYIDHRLQRERQVLNCFKQGYTSARAIAAQIYADRPEVLGLASMQVEAHLTKLKQEGVL